MITTNTPLGIKIPSDRPIVLVDDDEVDIKIATRCFKLSNLKNDFLAMHAGKEILDYLDQANRGVVKAPALLLLDINMPLMGGLEVLRSIREDKAFDKKLPIIMLTNSEDLGDINRAKQLGADGYHHKSLQMADYVDFFNSFETY